MEVGGLVVRSEGVGGAEGVSSGGERVVRNEVVLGEACKGSGVSRKLKRVSGEECRWCWRSSEQWWEGQAEVEECEMHHVKSD